MKHIKEKLLIVGLLFISFYASLHIFKPFTHYSKASYFPNFPSSSSPQQASVSSEPSNEAQYFFKKEIERQAHKFPDVYFLEQPASKRKKVKQIALTFDDSPDDWYCPQVLRILDTYQVKATFFLVANRLKTYYFNAKAIKDAGHLIGNHSFAHQKMTEMTTEQALADLHLAEQEFLKYLEIQPLLFRPPYGVMTDEQIIELGIRNYKIINWSIDTYDWDIRRNSPEQILARVEKYAHNGGIILLHSSGKDRENTLKVLPSLITFLQNEGYEFVTLDKLLAVKAF